MRNQIVVNHINSLSFDGQQKNYPANLQDGMHIPGTDNKLPELLFITSYPYRFLNLSKDKNFWEELRTVSCKKVFILDCLSLFQDYARSKDEAAQKQIHALISEVYESLSFPTICIPVLQPEEDYISFCKIFSYENQIKKHPHSFHA